MKTPPVHSDPEELIRALEQELSQRRGRRAGATQSRMAFRVFSLGLVTAMAFAAVFALQYFASQMQPPRGENRGPASEGERSEAGD